MSEKSDSTNISLNSDLLERYRKLQGINEQLDKDIQKFEDLKSMVTKNEYMKILHEYNNIKDAAQIVMGSLANIQGVTVKELHTRYNLPTGKDADL